ncbi:MAG: synthase subunit [Actinomycetota bacterium]|jgi:F-type H+-transporting ATPase subunit b
MSVAQLSVRIAEALVGKGDPSETPDWLLPKPAELIYGGIASVIVFGLLFKLAGPAARKALADRSERIGREIDDARRARIDAEADAGRIRSALGDISSERARMVAEADAQAATLLTEGRARIAAEMADMEAKATADISASAERGADELRAEIARLAAVATEYAVAETLDSGAQQALVEDFIAKVGSGR